MLYTVVSLEDIFSPQDNIISEERGDLFFSTNPFDYLTKI